MKEKKAEEPKAAKPISRLSFLKEKGGLKKWFIATEILARRK